MRRTRITLLISLIAVALTLAPVYGVGSEVQAVVDAATDCHTTDCCGDDPCEPQFCDSGLGVGAMMPVQPSGFDIRIESESPGNTNATFRSLSRAPPHQPPI